MIFSVWQPDGGYEYYEAPVRHGIGDDLPEISMPAGSRLGVPAQDVGRAVPTNARLVGSGEIPQGVMAPMDRSNVQGLSGVVKGITYPQAILFFAVGVILLDWYRGAPWTRRK